MVACDKRSSTSSNISPSDLSVAVAFTWSKRAEVVAPWRSLNFYSGFMRFACQHGGGWRKGGKERGRRDLMMMYRGRATERRENGRGGVPLYFHLRKKSLNTRKEKERAKEGKRKEAAASWKNITRYDSPGAIFYSLLARYLIVEWNAHSLWTLSEMLKNDSYAIKQFAQ